MSGNLKDQAVLEAGIEIASALNDLARALDGIVGVADAGVILVGEVGIDAMSAERWSGVFAAILGEATRAQRAAEVVEKHARNPGV